MNAFALILAIIAACVLGAALAKRAGKRLSTFNQAPPSTTGSAISLVCGEAVTDRYALMIRKNATSVELADEVGDIPIGFTQNDTVETDEVDVIPKAVYLLGIHPSPLTGIAGASITLGDRLVADLAAPGRVKPLPASAGTYVVIGRAMNAASSGGSVLVWHQHPVSVTVS